jgi:hypothetical protein
LTQPRKKKAKSGKPDQNEIARALEHYRVLRWFAVIHASHYFLGAD